MWRHDAAHQAVLVVVEGAVQGLQVEGAVVDFQVEGASRQTLRKVVLEGAVLGFQAAVQVVVEGAVYGLQTDAGRGYRPGGGRGHLPGRRGTGP